MCLLCWGINPYHHKWTALLKSHRTHDLNLDLPSIEAAKIQINLKQGQVASLQSSIEQPTAQEQFEMLWLLSGTQIGSAPRSGPSTRQSPAMLWSPTGLQALQTKVSKPTGCRVLPPAAIGASNVKRPCGAKDVVQPCTAQHRPAA